MFKNQYDTDVSIWSPHGRLYQVEYAAEAVKQGSVTIGIKSASYVVLASLKRSPQADSVSYQSKSFTISEKCGMSVAGLISDARVLARYMRNETMQHEYLTGTTLSVSSLAELVGSKCHSSTVSSSSRPFGVGLLIAGVDNSGLHLFQTCPTGHVYDSVAAAIGSRSQSARTYLERHYQTFASLTDEETVILHALKALAATCNEGLELSCKNTSISLVGSLPGTDEFRTLDEAAVTSWLKKLVIQPEDRVPDLPDASLVAEDFAGDDA